MTSPTVDTQTKHTPIIDESERRATVVVNQRAYDVPLDVAARIEQLERKHATLLALAERVAAHFADTDAPLGIEARAAIAAYRNPA